MASLPPSWMLVSVLVALIQFHAVGQMLGSAEALPRPLETRGSPHLMQENIGNAQHPGALLGLGYPYPHSSFSV